MVHPFGFPSSKGIFIMVDRHRDLITLYEYSWWARSIEGSGSLAVVQPPAQPKAKSQKHFEMRYVTVRWTAAR